jgi:hypothetical protein
MPQVAMNEIHGSWWDPSNPVVKMSGNLRSDLFDNLLEWEQSCDMCLTVGTSLSGMNADRLAESCGKRAVKKLKKLQALPPDSLAEADTFIGGTIIVGFQRTRLDSIASLRIFSSIDKVMAALAERLGLNLNPRILQYQNRVFPEDDIFELRGYDPITGSLLSASSTSTALPPPIITLNMSIGSRVRLLDGPYAGAEGEVVGRRDGNYKILFQLPLPPPPKSSEETPGSEKSKPKRMKTAPQNLMLGRWIIAAAVNGELKQFPILNL